MRRLRRRCPGCGRALRARPRRDHPEMRLGSGSLTTRPSPVPRPAPSVRPAPGASRAPSASRCDRARSTLDPPNADQVQQLSGGRGSCGSAADPTATLTATGPCSEPPRWTSLLRSTLAESSHHCLWRSDKEEVSGSSPLRPTPRDQRSCAEMRSRKPVQTGLTSTIDIARLPAERPPHVLERFWLGVRCRVRVDVHRGKPHDCSGRDREHGSVGLSQQRGDVKSPSRVADRRSHQRHSYFGAFRRNRPAPIWALMATKTTTCGDQAFTTR
jgi:hypothetical protein